MAIKLLECVIRERFGARYRNAGESCGYHAEHGMISVLIRRLKGFDEASVDKKSSFVTSKIELKETTIEWSTIDYYQKEFICKIFVTLASHLLTYLTIHSSICLCRLIQNGKAYFLHPLRNHRCFGCFRTHAPCSYRHSLHHHALFCILHLPIHGFRGYVLGRRIPSFQGSWAHHVQDALWSPWIDLHCKRCCLCLLYCSIWSFAD
jgi:hypothetical protein